VPVPGQVPPPAEALSFNLMIQAISTPSSPVPNSSFAGTPVYIGYISSQVPYNQ
jgi:hypothetical protein